MNLLDFIKILSTVMISIMRLIFVFFLFFPAYFFSQSLTISAEDSTVLELMDIKIATIRRQFLKKNNTLEWWNNTKVNLTKKGFEFCSLDSTENGFKLFLGNSIKKIVLENSLSDKIFPKNKKKKAFDNILDAESYAQQILDKYKKEGYTFAKYRFSDCQLLEDTLYCSFQIDSNRKIHLDSLYLDAATTQVNLPFAKRLLKPYLNKNFNIESIYEVEKKIEGSEIYQLSKPIEIIFSDSTASLLATLQHRKSSRFYAFLGLLPNAYNSGSLQITADLQLSLANLWGRGIQLALNWQKPQDGNQFLDVSNRIPMLFGTPFGTHLNFKLEKFDTSFLRLYFEGGVDYTQDLHTQIQVYYSYLQSQIITLDTSSFVLRQLPKNLDFNHKKIGLRYKYRKTDKFLLPQQGWILEGTFEIGNKTIHINQRIATKPLDSNYTYQKLYDSIGINQTVLYLQTNLDKYTPLSTQMTVRNRLLAQFVGSNSVLNNELLTFGGVRLPRGFDDHFFRAPYFITLSTELQYFLTKRLMAAIAYDHTFSESSINNSKKNIQPKGIALGLNWISNQSFFNFWFALGNNSTTLLGFNQSKAHFGYVAMF